MHVEHVAAEHVERRGRGVAWRLLACAIVGCAMLAAAARSVAVPRQRTVRIASAAGSTVALTAVSCSSAIACTAVGTSYPTPVLNDGERGVFVTGRWNGRRWSIERLPTAAGGLGPPYTDFGTPGPTVSCPTNTVCFVVATISVRGTHCTCLTTVPLVERWFRGRWSIERTPRASRALGHIALNDVSCSSPSACTAVGSGKRPLAERWNGRRWSIEPTSGPKWGAFVAVSCASQRGCVAVGSDSRGVLGGRWNGSGWSVEPIPSGGYLRRADATINAVSCPSINACVATGGYQTFCPSLKLGLCAHGVLTWRWDGSRWSLHSQPYLDISIYVTGYGALSCTSASWCVAASIGGSQLYRWDGQRWATEKTPGAARSGLVAVSCTSTKACMAVGSEGIQVVGGGGPSVPLAWRWNGRRWIDVSPPPPSAPPTTG